MASPTLTLSNGNKIPIVGLGTMAHHEPNKLYQAIRDAINVGYRHFDTAHIYMIEEEVGRAVNDATAAGDVTREELFITTKLWMDKFNRDKVVPALKESLAKLNLAYVDLYLMHSPLPLKGKDENGAWIMDNELDLSKETWPGMEECVELGLAKNIGVSNFNAQQIDQLLEHAKIKPTVHQVESHPHLSNRKLLDFCTSKQIVLTAYSPMGGTPNPDRNQSHNNQVRLGLFEEPLVKQLAAKYNKSEGQVLIKFNAQRGLTVIPKSFTPSRITENINIFDFELTTDEIAALEALNRNERYCVWKTFASHRNFPFTAEF